MWKRYIFKTKSDDCRPLIYNPKYPWWLSGYHGSFTDGYAIIVVYLPIDEDLSKYWDDAYDIEYTIEDKITFSDEFQKPDCFVGEYSKEVSNMLNVYIVERQDDWSYDECIEQTIVAETEERALELASKEPGVWGIRLIVNLHEEQVLTKDTNNG